MERIGAGQPYMVVDYAHSADSLEKALIVDCGSVGDGDQFTCAVGRRKGIQVALGLAPGRCDPACRNGTEKGHAQSIFAGKERRSGTILPSRVRLLPRSATLA